MTTPIYNFVQKYIKSGTSRFHMPGHKGNGPLGVEPLDITEIAGADILYGADGIIAESEENATALFKTAHTYYSTEGSTLAIKAMLALAIAGKSEPVILAARNVHKAFIFAAALLDFGVEWIYPDEGEHLCSCHLSPDGLQAAIEALPRLPDAVYITSPDYLGNIADVSALSEVCRRYGIPLLVDNAHGAYLAFTAPALHPIAQGAAMCADSAHKSLPALTGGAYLHISKNATQYIASARNMLSLFASTSPSYLILQSLDLLNSHIFNEYPQRLECAISKTEKTKRELQKLGFAPESTEPLKIVINAAKYGYTGDELAEHLRQNRIECEFSDRDFIVLMTSTENGDADYSRLVSVMSAIKPKTALPERRTVLPRSQKAMTLRKAVLSPSETIRTELAEGRILAAPTVSCPPAVPIAVSGELITKAVIEALTAYGISEVSVVV